MLSIAIDGACRRNGKPDCTSSGGVFFYGQCAPGVNTCGVDYAHEYNSTNQRGEMLALIKALELVKESFYDIEVMIITDSEYLFNAMTKRWYDTWYYNEWYTSSGSLAKNADLWEKIRNLMVWIDNTECEIHFYHIKGHCIPFGRVTADNLLMRDPSGRALYNEVLKKFDTCAPTKHAVFAAAQELSEKNNGFKLYPDTFKQFVAMNVMADAIATKAVDLADSGRKR